MHTAFQDLLFDDTEQAQSSLATLLADTTDDFAGVLAHAISETANHQVTLVRLQRFLEADQEHLRIRERFLNEPRFVQMLCHTLGQSNFLTDIVCRNPEYALDYWNGVPWHNARTREGMIGELLDAPELVSTLPKCGETLRRFKSREIFRIAARDLFEHAPLMSITEDLSNLADAALEVAYRCVLAQLTLRYGAPQYEGPHDQPCEATFVVLSMGKLGALELNFSSDIDLLFLYSDDGETAGGTSSPITNLEFFCKLGEQLIKAISELTPQGNVFRVDMRLRPYGRLSPLAVSQDNALAYYFETSRAWERQALIKARPSAGDIELGMRFVDATRSLVFPRYFDDDTLEDICSIKRQTEEQTRQRGEAETEVKLGHGGIRDIEFTIQMLQMLNGGRFPALRTPASLNAIAALGQHGLLSPFEANTLASNYTFLRQVEHRLQVEGGQQVHALPHAENVLNEFARRMGYVSAQSFMAEYRDRAAETRSMLKRFLAVEGAGNLWIQDLLNPNSDGEEGKDQLVVRGFREVNKAREELINLYSGPSEHPYPAHVRRRFTAILPTLIQALSECSNPDESLLRVGLILSRISAPGVIYDIIQHNPSLAQILVTVVSNSEYLAEILVRDPGLFDLLGSSGLLESPSTYEGLEQQLEYLSRAHDSAAALYRLRDGETLRIGLRDLLERADIIEIGLELTQLAEICLRNALSRAREDVRLRQGPVHGSFAVFGLGKMGGCELGYGSDLDLLFVYSADASTENGMAASQYYALVASGLIRILKEPTRYGALYDIDARLRPDGNKGTLVATDRRIEEYYRTEAQAWERLALTKLRFVAGDEDFGKDLEQRLRAIAFDGPLPAEDIDKIEEVRGKIVAQANHLDIKKSEGGMAELEFAVRLLQMRHALTTPTMNRADVLGTLLVMQAHEILPNEDIKTLQNAYIFFRRVENRIRLATGLRGGKLPDSPAELASLAQKLNIDGNLMELFLSARSQVHAIYENAVASHRE